MKFAGTSRARRAVSDVIAVLLLVVIVVAVIGFFLAFAYGLVQSTLIEGPPAYATAVSEMTVPGSNSTVGVLSLAVRNSGSSPVIGISLTCPSSFSVTSNCLTDLNTVNSTTGALAVGKTASFEGAVSSASKQFFQAGTNYLILVTVSFSSGSTLILPLNVYAKS